MSRTLKRRQPSRGKPDKGQVPGLEQPVQVEIDASKADTAAGKFGPNKLLRGAWIDGKPKFASSGETFPAVDPWSGRVMAQVAQCGPMEVERAVFTARRALESGDWPGMTAGRRAQVLFRFADLLETRGAELALTEAHDTGRPLNETLHHELPRAVATIREIASQGGVGHGDGAGQAGRGAWTLRRGRAVGVVAVVLSWQSVLLDAAWGWASAWMAGCTVVTKPAPEASLLSLRLAAVAEEAGLPAGVLNVLPGPAECGEALVTHQGIDAVVFTGRPSTLARVRAAAASLPVIADVGGLCPVLVLEDADVEVAAEQVAQSAFAFAGQLRRSVSRVLVAAAAADDFLASLGEVVTRRAMGDPSKAGTLIGPMIETGRAEYARWIAQRCLGHGGRRVVADVPDAHDASEDTAQEHDRDGVLKPCVFETSDRACPAACRPVVGPMLAVTIHDNAAELLAAAQDLIRDQGQDVGVCPAAGVWTRDLHAAHRVAERLPCEHVYLNAMDPYGHGMDASPLRRTQRVTAILR